VLKNSTALLKEISMKETKRIGVITLAIVAVLLLMGWYVYPGDLPFTPVLPK
jgi:hypothetical protein